MSTNDLRFTLSGVPANTFCILVSGDSIAPTNMSNPCVGQNFGLQAIRYDGLHCAVLNIRRHGGRSANANGIVGTTNPWGGEDAPAAGIASTGAGVTSGQTRYFQAVYRDDQATVCGRGLNTSQAVRIQFTP